MLSDEGTAAAAIGEVPSGLLLFPFLLLGELWLDGMVCLGLAASPRPGVCSVSLTTLEGESALWFVVGVLGGRCPRCSGKSMRID